MKPRPTGNGAFSLLEILVAMAVLTMLMAFMFSMLGGTIRLWEQGNSQIEAAQAARVGLNKIAEDFRSAFAGTAVSSLPTGADVTSIVPFLAVPDANEAPGAENGVDAAAGSDQIFGIRTPGETDDPVEEFGYLCVYISKADGVGSMRGDRYFLVRHGVEAESGDFYFRNAPTTSWVENAGLNRSPVIDNCLRLEILYPDPANWGSWTKTWSSQTALPPGALVTVITIDSRTAERVARLTGGTPLTDEQISSVTNGQTPTDAVTNLLREEGVVMRRFIAFPNAR